MTSLLRQPTQARRVGLKTECFDTRGGPFLALARVCGELISQEHPRLGCAQLRVVDGRGRCFLKQNGRDHPGNKPNTDGSRTDGGDSYVEEHGTDEHGRNRAAAQCSSESTS